MLLLSLGGAAPARLVGASDNAFPGGSAAAHVRTRERRAEASERAALERQRCSDVSRNGPG